MKPVLCSLLIILLFSCNKEIITTEMKLTGSWELRKEYGGFPNNTTTYSNGNGNILKFTTKTCSRYENGQLVETRTYELIRDTSLNKTMYRIVYDGNFSYLKTLIRLQGNTISFSVYIPDGSGSQYERID